MSLHEVQFVQNTRLRQCQASVIIQEQSYDRLDDIDADIMCTIAQISQTVA